MLCRFPSTCKSTLPLDVESTNDLLSTNSYDILKKIRRLIIMTKVIIEPGICGLTTYVTANYVDEDEDEVRF